MVLCQLQRSLDGSYSSLSPKQRGEPSYNPACSTLWWICDACALRAEMKSALSNKLFNNCPIGCPCDRGGGVKFENRTVVGRLAGAALFAQHMSLPIFAPVAV